MNRAEAQIYFDKLNGLFSSFSRIAVVTTEFETLYLRHQYLGDIASLPQSAEVSQKYLNLQDGDIVITNDPFSGGTILSSPTLILGVGTKSQKNQVPAELLIACRLTLLPRAGAYKTIDEEGLRIPPSPLYIKGEVNKPLVEALRAHPLSPKSFVDNVEQCAEQLLKVRQKIKNEIHSARIEFSKPTIKAYLKATETAFLKKLDMIGEGSSNVEFELTDGETIKLRAEHHDGYFNFDFSGTSVGSSLFMTDTAAIGATIGAILSLISEPVPLNSGIFARFDVKTPRGSLVNSAFPRPVGLGHTDGINAVANLVLQAMGRIHKKLSVASSGLSFASYQLQFRDQRIFVDALNMGLGATPGKKGVSASHLWRRIDATPSLERWEAEFPLQVVTTQLRAQSAGAGQYEGGSGMTRIIKLLDDAELSWNQLRPTKQPEGVFGGKAGQPTIMYLEREGGTKEELQAYGKLQLKKGDQITVLSPGGAGFGAPKEN